MSKNSLILPGFVRDHESHPSMDSPEYKSTRLRHPTKPLIFLPHKLSEVTGPLLGADYVNPGDNDLTTKHEGEALGQRIVVYGKVVDANNRPVPNTLVEIWQANAAGRYLHIGDRWPAPLDPNFDGVGRVMTDSQGNYEFLTIKPGAYPWKNHDNAWRPAHIHFSLFGRSFTQRLVTQMYFPDDPLFFQDPIFNSVPELARPRLISRFDLAKTRPEWALAFEFNIVLRGSEATPLEEEDEDDEV
jgi:protocatechuate 3,4-dioxygenase beta subunit